MTNVNKRNRQKQTANKSNRFYYVIFLALLALVTITLFLMQPRSTNDVNEVTPTPSPSDQENGLVNEEGEQELPLPLRNYFKQDGDVAHFLGFGNEYAEFTETTTWLFDEYIEIQENNGGAEIQRVYRIKQDAIELVYEEVIEEEQNTFTMAQLNQLESLQTILKWPIIDGATIDNKTVSYPVTYQTPYKNYENLIQVSEEVEGGKNNFYYADGDGLVAKEFIMDDGYEVTSVLETINGESAKQ